MKLKALLLGALALTIPHALHAQMYNPAASSGSGSPGGTSGSIQYNASGAFAGATITGLVYANGSSAPTAATYANITSLWSGCSGTQYLGFDGSCHTPSGGVSTVFGRAGAVIAQSGDYTVSQVTGAAPLASPTFTGTVTLPSGQIVNGVTLTSGGSATTYLNGAGGYTTPSGSGNTTSTSLTNNALSKANGANSIVNSLFTDNGTNGSYTGTGGFTSSGAISSTGPSGDAGLFSLIGNTANQTLAAGSFNLLGPLSGSVTAFGWQVPAAVNGSAGVVHLSAPTGAISQLSVSPVSLTADVSGVLPVANGGNGSASPAIVAGSNISVSGSWPTQTVNVTAPSNANGIASTGTNMRSQTASDLAALDAVAFAHDPSVTVAAEWPFMDQTGTTVADVSGNGNTATFGATAPTWNGDGVQFLPVVGATPQTITTPLTNYTAILIAYTAWNNGQLQTPQSSGTTTGIATGGAPGNPYPTLWGTTTATATGTYVVGTRNAGFIASGFQPTAYNDVAGSFGAACNFPTGGNHILMYIPDATSDKFIIDGTPCTLFQTSANSGNISLSTGTYIFGASKASNVGFGFRGTIRYAIAYSTSEPTTAAAINEEKRVANIIAARPSANQPPTYPQVNLPNEVVTDVGDSLTACYEATAACGNATYITPTNNTYNFQEWGIGGMTVQDMAYTAGFRWAQSISAAAVKNIVFIWGGTNDLADGYTAAQAYNGMTNAARIARNLDTNAAIVAVTMISRTGQDANKDLLNPLIRNNAVSSGLFNYVFDLGETAALGADGAYNNPSGACFQTSDHVHLTGMAAGTCVGSLAGYNYELGLKAAFLNHIDGYTATNPHNVTATYSMTTADGFLTTSCASNCTITVPDCTSFNGPYVAVTNLGSAGTVTVAPFSAAQTINGSTSSVTLTSGAPLRLAAQIVSQAAGGCTLFSY